jgi:hypothetical protein
LRVSWFVFFLDQTRRAKLRINLLASLLFGCHIGFPAWLVLKVKGL